MSKKRKLPSKIELIDEKRGNVREYDFDHAQRILSLQHKINLGKLKIFNTALYHFDHEQGVISHRPTEQPTTDINQAIGGEEGQ